MAEIIGKVTAGPDVKRFYLPGITIRDTCPNCKKEIFRSMGEYYLSYPEVGTPIELNLYCSDCDIEWEVPIILDITVKLA